MYFSNVASVPLSPIPKGALDFLRQLTSLGRSQRNQLTHAPPVDRSASPSSPFMELNEPNFARRGKFFCRSSGYPAMNIKPANKSRLSPPSFNAIQLLSSYLISHFTFFDHHSFSNLRAGRGCEESRTSSVWVVVISGRGTNPLLARLPSLQCQYPFQTILVSY